MSITAQIFVLFLALTGYSVSNLMAAQDEAKTTRTFMCEITAPEHMTEKGRDACAKLLAKNAQD
ncbi:MAG: hypothetical protein ACI9TY_000493 [Alphaproteobacteria bacterium]|jgi:hypothetical protein